MKRIIAIANHKGGVGKTTTVASLGSALSRMGKRVLLVDLDPQCNLTETIRRDEYSRTIYEALRDLKSLPIYSAAENLDICPASVNLVALDVEFSSVEGREERLSRLLQGVDYDIILLDCPPNLGIATINALTAAREVIIPLTPEALPAKGLGTLLDIVEMVRTGLNPELHVSGIVITRYNRRKINRLVEETLREKFGDLVLKTRIRENVDVSEAPLFEKDIFSYSPTSIGATDYQSLAEEVLQIGNN